AFRRFPLLPLLVALAGCGRGSPTLGDGPPGPLLHVVATSPAQGAQDAPLGGVIRGRVDRFLRPRAPGRPSAPITPGIIQDDGTAPAGDAFAVPTYDVLERVVVLHVGGLIPGNLYTAVLRKPSDYDGNGFRAWDGAELEKTYVLGFTTTTKTD